MATIQSLPEARAEGTRMYHESAINDVDSLKLFVPSLPVYYNPSFDVTTIALDSSGGTEKFWLLVLDLSTTEVEKYSLEFYRPDSVPELPLPVGFRGVGGKYHASGQIASIAVAETLKSPKINPERWWTMQMYDDFGKEVSVDADERTKTSIAWIFYSVAVIKAKKKYEKFLKGA